MHYRIVLQIHVQDLPRVRAIRDALQPFIRHNIPINPGLDNQEPGFIELHRCYHDEDPVQPCLLLFRWDGIDGVVVPDRD